MVDFCVSLSINIETSEREARGGVVGFCYGMRGARPGVGRAVMRGFRPSRASPARDWHARFFVRIGTPGNLRDPD